MNFTTLINVLDKGMIGCFFLGIVLIILGGTVAKDKVGIIGYILLCIGIFGYFSYEQIAVNMFNQEKVRVVTVDNKNNTDYVKVIVPKEDADKITSKESSINELKEYYNENYPKDRYLDEKDTVEIILDNTAGYDIKEINEN